MRLDTVDCVVGVVATVDMVLIGAGDEVGSADGGVGVCPRGVGVGGLAGIPIR